MEKQEFDLNKNYTWDENSQVTLTGKQYGFIRHFVNMVIGSPEAQRVMLGMEIAGFLQGILEEGIKQGWVKEKESATELIDKNAIFVKTSSNYKSFETLTDKNHYSTLSINDILSAFDVKYGDGIIEKPYSITHTITSWVTETTERDNSGNPLDILVHKDGWWIPEIEYFYLIEAFLDQRFNDFKFGYMEGESTHLSNPLGDGPSDRKSYKFWIDMK